MAHWPDTDDMCMLCMMHCTPGRHSVHSFSSRFSLLLMLRNNGFIWAGFYCYVLFYSWGRGGGGVAMSKIRIILFV